MRNKNRPTRLIYTVPKPCGKNRVHNGRKFHLPLQHGPRPSAVRAPEACRCLHREFHGYFGQAVLQARFRPLSFRFQKGTVLRSGPPGWIPFRTVPRATLRRVQGQFRWDHPAKAQVWNMTFRIFKLFFLFLKKSGMVQIQGFLIIFSGSTSRKSSARRDRGLPGSETTLPKVGLKSSTTGLRTFSENFEGWFPPSPQG